MLVKSKELYSIQRYCSEFLNICPILKRNEDELRTILDGNGYDNLWDYPLDEIDHIVENELNVVLVDTSYIDPETHNIVQEYRWFEIPDLSDTDENQEENYQKYMEFLKEEIKEYCNQDGNLEFYWDYREELAPETILDAYENYKEQGYEYIEDYIEDTLLSDNNFYAMEEEQRLLRKIISDMENHENEYIRNLAIKENDSLMGDLEKAGYGGIDVNLKDLLRLTRIKVNVMFATDKERNYDMSSIVSSFGSWFRPDLEYVDENILDNALTYFIHQQGHTVEEVYNCMFDNPRGFSSVNQNEDNSFAKAIVNDIVNNSSDGLSELTALIELSGEDIITFFNMLESKEKYLVFDKNTDIGIFNEWSGCGGLLELQLDKPFVVPSSMVRGIQIEGAKNANYSVNHVYGLIGSCWKDTLSYTDEKPELRKENLNDMLIRIRKECA